MQVRKLSYAGGAEVTGLDLSKELPQSTIDAIRALWLENLVLVFPGQEFTIEQHIRFSRQFGDLEEHPLKSLQSATRPEIFEITNERRDGKVSETGEIGRQWHSDGAFTLRPPTGSFLHCRALPDVGGNTWFANMYMAYETLSPKMKEVIEQLEVVNDVTLYYTHAKSARDLTKVAAEGHDNPAVIQPMVRVHPETGRKSLFISEAVVVRIHGMTEEESAPLLQYLFRHATRPEFTYRHYWRRFDLVLWDNRCLQHLAPKDFDFNQVRHMCRTTLIGEACGRVEA